MTYSKKQKILDIFGKEPDTLDELGHCIVAVANHDNKNLDGIAWGIEYDPKVSNSHECPELGQKNWARNGELPMYYPGFRGRLWVRSSEYYKEPFLSSLLDGTLTYMGSGSGGATSGPWKKYYYSQHIPNIRLGCYEFKFFLDDWPIISNMIGKKELFRTLNDDDRLRLHHNFLWESDEAITIDRKVLGDDAYESLLLKYQTNKIKF